MRVQGDDVDKRDPAVLVPDMPPALDEEMEVCGPDVTPYSMLDVSFEENRACNAVDGMDIASDAGEQSSFLEGPSFEERRASESTTWPTALQEAVGFARAEANDHQVGQHALFTAPAFIARSGECDRDTRGISGHAAADQALGMKPAPHGETGGQPSITEDGGSAPPGVAVTGVLSVCSVLVLTLAILSVALDELAAAYHIPAEMQTAIDSGQIVAQASGATHVASSSGIALDQHSTPTPTLSSLQLHSEGMDLGAAPPSCTLGPVASVHGLGLAQASVPGTTHNSGKSYSLLLLYGQSDSCAIDCCQSATHTLSKWYLLRRH